MKPTKQSPAKVYARADGTPWLTVKNKAEADAAEMVIDGDIGESWWDDSGTTSKQFNEALNQIPKGRPINLHVSSAGGSIRDGLGIYNSIKARAEDFTAYIDGYAYSIASVFPLAAGKVVSPKSCAWLIHDPLGFTMGNIQEHERNLDNLQKNAEVMASVYAEKCGMDEEELRAMMRKETNFTGMEAVAYGFADTTGDEEVDAEIKKQTEDPEPDPDDPDEPEEMDATAKANMRKGMTAFNRLKKESMAIARKIFKPAAVMAAANLKQAGNAASATNQKSMSEKTETTVAAGSTTTASNQNNDKVIARFERERTARVTAEVTRRAESKIENDNLDFWINLAMNAEDETEVYDQIEAMAVKQPTDAGEPIQAERPKATIDAQEMEIRRPRCSRAPRIPYAMKIREITDPHKRFAALQRDWTGLMADAIKRDEAEMKRQGGREPVAVNSFSTGLTTDFLLDVSTTRLTNRFAALKALSRDFSEDRYKPFATAQGKFHVDSGAASKTAKGSTGNFETNADTVVQVPVTMNHVFKSFAVAQDEMMGGMRLENLAKGNLGSLANSVMDIALAPLANGTGSFLLSGTPTTVGSFGTWCVSTGTFGFTPLGDIWAAGQKFAEKNIILDGKYLSKIINQPTYFQMAGASADGASEAWRAFGWDNVALNTRWSAVPANVLGFACDPQAIVCVAGLPLTPPNVPGNTLLEAVETIPGIGLAIAAYAWFQLSTRTLWASFSVMVGANQGDPTAGIIIYNTSGAQTAPTSNFSGF